MKIDILTVTLGREYYLEKLLASFDKLANWQYQEVSYNIIYQGVPSEKFIDYIKGFKFPINISTTAHAYSIGAIMNMYKNELRGDYFWKLDDDAKLYSPHFLDHIKELYEIYPNAVFSPYPVGLINNPGGVPSKSHHVVYSKRLDTYYTLRKVNHIGGFARIMPSNLLQNISFTDSHSEDTECAAYFNRENIPMYYLENTLIVEHQESTLGQHERYKEYFKGRF